MHISILSMALSVLKLAKYANRVLYTTYKFADGLDERMAHVKAVPIDV